MDEQRERAKADAASKKGGHVNTTAYREVADDLGRAVEFTGYHEVVSEGAVRGIVLGGDVVSSAREGDEVELVLDRTPFYAEGGGQLADQGVIELDNGARLEVRDVQSPITGLVVHQVKVLSGEVGVGDAAHSEVDVERRRSISRAHTATHMVHKAFREALGETATQAGSENAPGRFRFDFSATGSVPASVLHDVEARVNDLVLADLGVHAELMTQEEAVRSGAMALFGEKYGDQVRVISVGDWARELCGGTHAGRSGQLGVIKLLGESSIGSGVRRVEALVGARRLPVPGARARAGLPAVRGAEGAPRGAARAGRRHRRAAARRREGDREASRRPGAGRRGIAGGRAPTTCTVSRSSRNGSTGRPGATYARWRSTCVAGCRATVPASSWSSARPVRARTPRCRSSRPSTTPPVSAGSAPTRSSAPSDPSSVAGAAARTTSPRAAAATRAASTRRSSWCAPRSP